MFNLPNPRNASQALRQAKCQERGIALLSNPLYLVEEKLPLNGTRFQVRKNDAFGTYYTVFPKINTCDCPAHGKDSYCKHVFAVLEYTRREAQEEALEAQIAAYESDYNAAECSTGCDYPDNF